MTTAGPRGHEFFGIYDDALDAEFCRRVIERFEADPGRSRGRTGDGSAAGAYDPRLKSCTEVFLDQPHWHDVRDAVLANLRRFAGAYMQRWRVAFTVPLRPESLRIARYDPGEHFDWHSDNMGASVTRVITAQWYLNTVESGGHTEYPWYDCRVQPVEGRLLLAPVGWTFLHRGAPPVSGPKYTVITQLHQVLPRAATQSRTASPVPAPPHPANAA